MSTEPNAETMSTTDLSADAVAAGALPTGATATPNDAPAATDAGAPTDPTASDAAAAAVATPAADATPAEHAAATAPAAAIPAAPVVKQSSRALVLGKRLLRFAFTLALFAAGVVIGAQMFVQSQPVTEVGGDPAVVGNPTPAAVAELVNAIAADDSDAIRAALAPEIFSNYTADLQNFGISKVEGVDTLGTYVDGPRTATVLVIHGRDVERNPFAINLVVLTQDGQIVRLR